ncbi:MAG: hypothetical protein SPE19_07575 [Candidatus Faecousia sp.]|nr:hypothetical protein [Candidatus Faecousia sp.]
MEKKSTNELNQILSHVTPDCIGDFLQKQSGSMIDQEKPFAQYLHQIISRNGLTQQEVFIQADFPDRFGYKLLSEEKRTKQRDYILRICYAAKMTLEETQRALTLYGMAPLYPRIPRDAVLMIAFNKRCGSILEVNALLASHKLPALKTSGSLE